MASRRWFKGRGHKRAVEWLRTVEPHQVGHPYHALNHCTLTVDGTVDQVFDCSNILLGDEPYVVQSLTEERKTYTIDRIVGRLEAQLVGTHGGTGGTYTEPGPVVFKWGVFVSTVDDTGAPLELDHFDLFSHTGQEASWLHRDSYCLGLNASASNPGLSSGDSPSMAAYCFPDSTTSRAPWGMVDITTKRHVAQQQRLFLMCAAEAKFDGNWNYTTAPAEVCVWTDLRCLGHWTRK